MNEPDEAHKETAAERISRALAGLAYDLVRHWEADLRAAKDAEFALLQAELEKLGSPLADCEWLKAAASTPPYPYARLSRSLSPGGSSAVIDAEGLQMAVARSRRGSSAVAIDTAPTSPAEPKAGRIGSAKSITSAEMDRSMERMCAHPTFTSLGGSLESGARDMSKTTVFSSRIALFESGQDTAFKVKFRPELQSVLAEQLKPGSRAASVSRVVSYDAARFHHQRTSLSLDESSWMVLRPDSLFRYFFEVLCLVALLHDSVVIPFSLAWQRMEGWMVVTSWCSLLTWTLDFALGFVTGYFKTDGECEMRWSVIARHYLRTWCAVDLLTVACDWVALLLLLLTGTGEDVEVAKAVRMARMLRSARIVVLVRLARNSRRALRFGTLALSNSSTGRMLLQVLKIMFFILWINHVFCCIWYAISRAILDGAIHTDTHQTWLELDIGNTGLSYVTVGVAYQYTTSMHWSMTQMTPGSMEVVPQNSYERAFNIFCLVFGLLFGTSLVGQMSSKMVQFNMSRQVEIKRMEVLRRFLRENNVSPALALRIQKQSAERMHDKSRLSEQDVEDVGYLSSNLRTQLRQEVFMPHLSRHPLFTAWSVRDHSAAKDLCASGLISYQCLSAGHDLFTRHQAIDKAYLLLKGAAKHVGSLGEDDDGPQMASMATTTRRRVQLISGTTMSLSAAEPSHIKDVPLGSWLCEIAIWLEWTGQGTLEAAEACEFVFVASTAVIGMLKHHPRIAEMTSSWCQALHEQLGSKGGDAFRWEVVTQHGHLVMNLPEDYRIAVGQQALLALEAKHRSMFGNARGVQELHEELYDGRCILTFEGNGDIIRTLPAVALMLSRPSDGKFLVLIAARSAGGNWTPVCMLPGRPMRMDEDPREVIEAVCEADLAIFVNSDLEFEESNTERETKESSTSGVKSLYLRTVFTARLSPNSPTRSEELVPPSPVRQQSSEQAPRPLGLDVEFVEDQSRKTLMYGWVTEMEFKMLQEGKFDDEITRISQLATSSRMRPERNIVDSHSVHLQPRSPKRITRGKSAEAAFDIALCRSADQLVPGDRSRRSSYAQSDEAMQRNRSTSRAVAVDGPFTWEWPIEHPDQKSDLGGDTISLV